MKVIFTKNAPAVIGPYSQALTTDGFIFCSGQIGVNPKNNTLDHDVEIQTQQALTNIKVILEEAGSDMNHIIKATVYMKHMSDYQKINNVYSQFFPQQKPARTAVEVSQLPREALVEIEVAALIKK